MSSKSRSVSRAVSEVVGSSKMMMSASMDSALADLDQLPLAGREALDGHVRGEVEIDQLQVLRGPGC